MQLAKEAEILKEIRTSEEESGDILKKAEAEKWLKDFRSFSLQLLDKNGNIKKKNKSLIKELHKEKQIRKCSNCGESGHYVSRCKK